MNINYIDCGLYRGTELGWFLDMGFEANCYGFEANPKDAEYCKDKFKYYKNVDIFNIAITDETKKVNLYLADGNGSSIFKSKNNVSDEFITVAGIKLSDFLIATVKPNDINILRFNIEGAEWLLINDLVQSGVYTWIDLYLGAGVADDIRKVDELKDKEEEYIKLLNDHDIQILPWCDGIECIDLKQKIRKEDVLK